MLYQKEIVAKIVEISYVSEDEVFSQNTEIEEDSFVDISGQVLRPGVYQIYRGDKISDLVEKAGGFSNDVNLEYLHKCLNLAEKLVNEQKVYVPANNEELPCGGSVVGNDSTMVTGSVSINNATLEQLETIPGVGPSTANNIISARPYSNISDLLKVSGIGDKTLEKISPYISL
jgi:competence protein ComEA